MSSREPNPYAIANGFLYNNGIRFPDSRAVNGRRAFAFAHRLFAERPESAWRTYEGIVGCRERFRPAEREWHADWLMGRLLLIASTLRAMRAQEDFVSKADAGRIEHLIMQSYLRESDIGELDNLFSRAAEFISSKNRFNERLLSRSPFNSRDSLLYDMNSIISLGLRSGNVNMDYGLEILRSKLLSRDSPELFLPGTIVQIANSFNLGNPRSLSLLSKALDAQEKHMKTIQECMPHSYPVFRALLGMANSCGFFLKTGRGRLPEFWLSWLAGAGKGTWRVGGFDESGDLRIYVKSDQLSDDMLHKAQLFHWVSTSFNGLEQRGPQFDEFESRFAVLFRRYGDPVIKTDDYELLDKSIQKWREPKHEEPMNWIN
ncbi:Uncharacterised protein [uncultured archaeon]|nr:Uncharacterised protein [uncultured archaeon]